jgi:hypothetical protein
MTATTTTAPWESDSPLPSPDPSTYLTSSSAPIPSNNIHPHDTISAPRWGGSGTDDGHSRWAQYNRRVLDAITDGDDTHNGGEGEGGGRGVGVSRDIGHLSSITFDQQQTKRIKQTCCCFAVLFFVSHLLVAVTATTAKLFVVRSIHWSGMIGMVWYGMMVW